MSDEPIDLKNAGNDVVLEKALDFAEKQRETVICRPRIPGPLRNQPLWFAKMSSHARRLRISNIHVDVDEPELTKKACNIVTIAKLVQAPSDEIRSSSWLLTLIATSTGNPLGAQQMPASARWL
jgi:hypothetical protein